MTPLRLFNWTLAALIAAVMSTSYLLDGPDDRAAELATSLSMQDALKSQVSATRFDRAARLVCGDAGWTVNYEEQVVCLSDSGKRSLASNP